LSPSTSEAEQLKKRKSPAQLAENTSIVGALSTGGSTTISLSPHDRTNTTDTISPTVFSLILGSILPVSNIQLVYKQFHGNPIEGGQVTNADNPIRVINSALMGVYESWGIGLMWSELTFFGALAETNGFCSIGGSDPPVGGWEVCGPFGATFTSMWPLDEQMYVAAWAFGIPAMMDPKGPFNLKHAEP